MEETEALRRELEHYKAEKAKIRDIVGQIGGKTDRRRHTAINVAFLIVVVAGFAFDLLRHMMGWTIEYLPPMLLLEAAVLLVSLKVIWMIHTESKVSHFQFWVLNSIEFQINMMTRRLGDMERRLKRLDSEEEDASAPSPAEELIAASRNGNV